MHVCIQYFSKMNILEIIDVYIYKAKNVSFTNTYRLLMTISSSTIGMTYRKAIRAISVYIYQSIFCQERQNRVVFAYLLPAGKTFQYTIDSICGGYKA